jgi:DNA invertase Pin-like site-specific DNA recombinase
MSGKAVFYGRVSGEEQAASGLGIEAQVAAGRDWSARHGLEFAGPYLDEAVSGATGLDDRPALLEAVAALEPGDVLLVAKRDRLGRDLIRVALIEAAVARKKARVVSAAGEGTESDDPSAILMRRMIDAFAEYERLVIKARTKAALKAKKARGERYGNVPFGWSLAEDGRTLAPDQAERDLAEQARAWRSEGRSLRAIATGFDELGIAPKAGGARWDHTSVRRLLERQPDAA